MKLPVKINRHGYFVIEALAFNEFVRQFYQRPFDFGKDQKVVSGIDCLYDISKSNEGYETDAKKLASFISTGHYEDLFEVLMGNLVKRGVLKAGRYLVTT